MTSPDLIHEEEALGKAYDARLMRRLLRYARAYRALVIGSLVLLLADGVLQLAGPALTQRVIDVGIPNGDTQLVVTSENVDPDYLATPYRTSQQIQRETDASRWHPTPCAARRGADRSKARVS